MRALSNVSLPRIAQSQDFHRSQAERANESRLNQNFHLLQGSIAEMEIIEDSLDKRIQKLENPAFSPAIDSVSDVTNWRFVKLNTKDAFASEKTDSIMLTTSTASGSLYYGDTSVTLPAGFSSISTVQVTAECDSDPIFAVVKSYTTSAVDVRIFSTTNGIHTFTLHVFITGKV